MTNRERQLRALAAKYWIELDGPVTYSGQEDLLAAIEEGDIERYAAVTHHEDFHYIRTFDRLTPAYRAAEENMGDSIYDEMPVAIHDLDTGKAWQPELSVSWRLAH
jgi:hypothetical protein